ncbi:MAG: hypothetical protein KBG39_09690 [Opitutaceae bacterium]|nr:hypothetical protein [Opitutaceae bacterium]
MSSNTRLKSILAVLCLSVCCASCSRTDDLAKERAAAEEAQRLAVERAALQETIAAKREQAAMDLESRSQQRTIKRAELMEAAAAEQVRRESLVSDLRDAVDSLDIRGERETSEGPRYLIDGKVYKPGDALRSSLGYTYFIDSKSGDNYIFTYKDESVEAVLKRPANGISLVSAKQLTELAPGVDAGPLNLLVKKVGSNPSQPTQHRVTPQPRTPTYVQERQEEVYSEQPVYSSGSIRLISAVYGAKDRNRDVTSTVAGFLRNGRGSFRVGNDVFGGDPYFGEVKTLTVRYSQSGRLIVREFREGSQASVP